MENKTLKRHIKRYVLSRKKQELVFQLQDHQLIADSLRMHQKIFDHYPDGVYTLDREGKVIELNRKLSELFGYSIEEMKHHYNNFLPQSEKKRVLTYFQKVLNGQTVHYKTAAYHKDGHLVYIHITNIPIQDYGEVIGVYGIAKDISAMTQTKHDLLQIKDHLNMAQKLANIGSWKYSATTGKVFLSRQVCNFFSLSYETSGRGLDEVMSFTTKGEELQLITAIYNAKNNAGQFELECTFSNLLDVKKVALVKGKASFNSNGDLKEVYGIIYDTTRMKYTEEKLLQQTAESLEIYNSLDATIWSYDVKKGQMTYCSDGAYSVYGVEQDTFISNPKLWLELVHPEDLPDVLEAQKILENGKKIRHQYRIITPLDELKWIDDQTIPIFNDDGELIHLNGISSDITQQKQYEQRLQFITEHDYLTGLPNRSHFEANLQSNLKSEPVFVLYLAIDRFSQINDTLGHHVGDCIIKALASRLTKLTADGTFVARINGDEFAIFIHATLSATQELAEAIIQESKKPLLINEYEVLLTTRIGISSYPADGKKSNQLLHLAYIAMQRVKRTHRSDYQFYTPSMNLESYKTFQLEKDLRQAISEQQLHLHYQPKVEADDGTISGAEALLRWQHPDWGNVSPAQFIPLAEENGLIFEIGDWVIDTVCAQIRTWLEAGVPIVPISINVSPKRLMRSKFKDYVQECMEKHHVPAELIELEITESSVLHQDVALKEMNDLRELGVTFSLDDFGTGYSSLSYLMKYNLDTIKIDKQLVQQIDEDIKAQAIVKSVIYLAKELQMDVVIEGVETISQLQFFGQLSSSLKIQGFIFSKPVPPEKLQSMLIQSKILSIELPR
ncbi:EAL domain-containing protein [Bacillus sp. FJAT-45037]|uniref:EAL domain-containing protein n=1 Tax=Bacillus sp. FJAT-45037 TaxID=2011007 RepID=UPI000C244524|nr:EAL domain-containing protein [Bacillus sp. FJAT-45037]